MLFINLIHLKSNFLFSYFKSQNLILNVKYFILDILSICSNKFDNLFIAKIAIDRYIKNYFINIKTLRKIIYIIIWFTTSTWTILSKVVQNRKINIKIFPFFYFLKLKRFTNINLTSLKCYSICTIFQVITVWFFINKLLVGSINNYERFLT